MDIKVIEIFGEPINRGGQESFVMSSLQHIDLSDLLIDMFTPYYCNNSYMQNIIESHGGKIFVAGLPFEPGKSRKNIVPCLKSYLSENKYDIAHIHSGSITALAYCAKVASQSGIKKVIVHSHSSGIKSVKHFLIKTYAAPYFMKYATDFCACSVEAAECKFPSAILQKVKILNNGVDASFFAYNYQIRDGMRKRYNIDENTIVLGHVGRFTYEKNQSFLIDLLYAYQKGNSSIKFKLVLLGEGPDKAVVEKKAEDLGLSQSVLFPTEYDKVRDYLQMFDIFLFPSIFEGLGIVGIEAQAAGLPVIASTGVPKTMKLTDDVEYHSLDNIDDWCKAIDHFRTTVRKDTRKQIKEAGFDIEETAKEVRILYVDSGK